MREGLADVVSIDVRCDLFDAGSAGWDEQAEIELEAREREEEGW